MLSIGPILIKFYLWSLKSEDLHLQNVKGSKDFLTDGQKESATHSDINVSEML